MQLPAIPIPSSVVNEALAAVPDPNTPLMLFGSFARGDSEPASDLDVLALGPKPTRVRKSGRVNLSVYSDKALADMAERGSLFVLHLRSEGRILRDPEGRLKKCLQAYRPPDNYGQLRDNLREVADLLDVSREEYSDRWEAYHDLVLHLLRTTLYAKFAELGQATFSLKEIAQRTNREEVSVAFSLRRSGAPAYGKWKVACALLEELLDTQIKNHFESPEALITNRAMDNDSILPLGLRLLGRPVPDFAYHL